MSGYASYIVIVKVTLSIALKTVFQASYLCTNYTARFSDNGGILFLKIAKDAFAAESLNYIDLTFTFK